MHALVSSREECVCNHLHTENVRRTTASKTLNSEHAYGLHMLHISHMLYFFSIRYEVLVCI